VRSDGNGRKLGIYHRPGIDLKKQGFLRTEAIFTEGRSGMEAETNRSHRRRSTTAPDIDLHEYPLKYNPQTSWRVIHVTGGIGEPSRPQAQVSVQRWSQGNIHHRSLGPQLLGRKQPNSPPG